MDQVAHSASSVKRIAKLRALFTTYRGRGGVGFGGMGWDGMGVVGEDEYNGT